MRLTKEQNQKYNNYIIDSICDNPKDLGYSWTYSKASNKDRAKLDFFFYCFQNEYNWNIIRKGEQKALAEYLSGLPSTIDIPFENYKILELAKDFGSLPKNASEKEEDKILDNYWNFMASKLIKLNIGVK